MNLNTVTTGVVNTNHIKVLMLQNLTDDIIPLLEQLETQLTIHFM